jgi:AmiR/NasT family two-component response regulator
MTTALLCTSSPPTAPSLAADLSVAGITLLATVNECNKLVQAAVRYAPDVVICDVSRPGGAWFEAIRTLEKIQPSPTLFFTQDADAAHIVHAIDCGVHVYVVQGYASHRLRALVHLAQARHGKTREQQRALEDMATRFEERKAVDRAKGILMRAQSLSDDDAFRTLRSAAMSSNQRMGQLSQHIIQSAQVAESVNRAGQLRMLSQRLVKLHLLQAAGLQEQQLAVLLQQSVQWVDSNFILLRKNLSQPTYGDLLEQVAGTWEQLKAALAQSDSAAVEDAAEALLLGAERLTGSLEGAGTGAPLRVLNLAGRQRMLSQRFAKFALLATRDISEDAVSRKAVEGMRDVQQEFEAALTYLNGIPLSTPDIHADLSAAGVAWLQMVDAAREGQRKPLAQRGIQRDALARGSDALLELFDRLSVHYEHSMHMLMGKPPAEA